MITTQALSLMDDSHLIASLHADMDSLTSTPIERELLKRFEETVDGDSGLRETAEELDYELADADEMLRVLAAAEIEDAADLKRRLAIASAFESLIEDAGDIFTRLHQLAQTTQE